MNKQAARPASALDSRQLQFFVYLQLMDALTTLIGLRLGAQEVGPVVRLLATVDPLLALAVSKLAGLWLALICWRSGRWRLLERVNYFFAALVLWNTCVVLLLA